MSDFSEGGALPPDENAHPDITFELFREWRTPRFGQSNPERMNNPVWEWLVKSRLTAYEATERLKGPSAMEAGPGWCFDRLGQSSTLLPDMRTVFIAGEHEDHYDPDFYIYNDVVVLYPDGSTDIFGYPREIFPPTDFHSATFVDNNIVIIGNLGYPDARRPGTTPVFILDLNTFAMTRIETLGTPPGWIYKHNANLTEGRDSIIVERGMLDRGEQEVPFVENIDDWKLHLTHRRWERLTERRWQRFAVARKDRKANHIWHIRSAAWSRSMGWEKEFRAEEERIKELLGSIPDFDLVTQLYCPSLPYEQLPKAETEFNVFRIKIDGVIVRYVEDMFSIQVTVEGELPETFLRLLASDLVDKLSALENTAYELRQL